MLTKINNWLIFLKEKFKYYLIGAGTVLDLYSHIHSYEERFGTDEELLASDIKPIEDDLKKAKEDFSAYN